jgi:two-component system sensor histidine kinase/response regulator
MKPAPNHCILLVEDEALVRTIAEETLREAGYAVLSVTDGLEAQATLSRVRPDLILSDVRMPRSDGIELLRWVRAHAEFEFLPFIFVSAKGDTADLRTGMALGADDYVTKPYLVESLLEAVACRLERAARRDAREEKLREFLADRLPHDLRSPLTGILGYTDLMIAAGEAGEVIPPAQLQKFARNLQLSGRRLLRLAENLALWYDFERLLSPEAGRAPAPRTEQRLSPRDLERPLRECAEHYARPGDFTLRLEPATILVASRGLMEIFRHLVDNAFRFSIAGTPVSAQGRVEGQFYVFEVGDRGRGLKSDQIHRLVGASPLDPIGAEPRASGVGLALVRGFTRLCGGRFTLTPHAPPPGLTARLVLPLAPPKGQAVQPEPQPAWRR